MNLYINFIRSVHIISSVLWVGSAFFLVLFVSPAVRTFGREGGRFMEHLSKTNKLPLVMQGLSFIAVASGLLLLYRISGGFNSMWLSTTRGIVLLTGGTFALAAYVIGFLIIGPTVGKMSALGKILANNSTPPSTEQLNLLTSLQNRMTRAQLYDLILLFMSLFMMSIIRYI